MKRLKFLVLHGPNLNLLGRREPEIYGDQTLDSINRRLGDLAQQLDVDVEFLQSNHEGVLVDRIHASFDTIDGAILNPAGLTQHGVSLHDAIKAVPFPVIEVHLSNIAAREPWRHHSIISPAAKATIQGFGWRSYTAAFQSLVDLVREHQSK